MFKPCAKLACVVAVVLSGCGGNPVEEPVPDALGSEEQSIIWDCGTGRKFNRYWWVNNVEVGREYCDCDGTYQQFGTLSGRYTQQLIEYCY
ncbi:hypothetical protein ACLEPN_29520 [Myxococcus sp. 1LA]